MTIYECKYFYVYILSLVFFIIEVEHVLLDFTKKRNRKRKKYITSFFGVCCEHMWFLIFIERCTLGSVVDSNYRWFERI